MDECAEPRVIEHERSLAVLEHRVSSLETQVQEIITDIKEIKSRSFWTLMSTSALLLGYLFQLVTRKVGL